MSEISVCVQKIGPPIREMINVCKNKFPQNDQISLQNSQL